MGLNAEFLERVFFGTLMGSSQWEDLVLAATANRLRGETEEPADRRWWGVGSGVECGGLTPLIVGRGLTRPSG